MKIGDRVRIIWAGAAYDHLRGKIGTITNRGFDSYDWIVEVPEEHPRSIYEPGSFLHRAEISFYYVAVYEAELQEVA